MKQSGKFLFAAVVIGLAISGCKEQTAPVSSPATKPGAATESATPAKPEHSPANPPTGGEQPGVPTTAAPVAVPSPASQPAAEIPVQYLAPKLQTALSNFKASGDIDARSSLVSDVANLAVDGVPKPQVAAALGQMFRAETSVEVRNDILNELSNLEDPAALSQIVQGLDASLPEEVRQSAITALETLDDPRAIAALKPLLSDRSQQIREAAQDAIDSLTPEPTPP